MDWSSVVPHAEVSQTRQNALMAVASDDTAALLAGISFDAAGLVPAIAQQHDTGQVLMLAWMNADSLRQTVETGRATYWSRSRNQLWAKGDTSGNIQYVREIRIDCDSDALLLMVDQTGPACHTGKQSCFDTAVIPVEQP